MTENLSDDLKKCTQSITGNLPYLHDGMALFYAASEQGDYKAANAQRTAAYTEKKQPEAKKAKSKLTTPNPIEIAKVSPLHPSVHKNNPKKTTNTTNPVNQINIKPPHLSYISKNFLFSMLLNLTKCGRHFHR